MANPQKTIFITGASSGLGKATAKLFASKNWKVIATMRNPSQEEELNLLENIFLMPLDVTNPEQIELTIQAAIANNDIDVVFNNAGYGLGGPMEAYTDEQIVRQINTNLLGVLRVTKVFIPHFRKKKSGLFITTSSIGGHVSFPFNSVYNATKWAIEGWSESLAYELNQFGIGVKTISPGVIKTDFINRSMEVASQIEYDTLEKKAMEILDNPEFEKMASSAAQIAEIVYEAATDGKDKLRYIAGADANETYERRSQVGAETFRNEMNQVFFGR